MRKLVALVSLVLPFVLALAACADVAEADLKKGQELEAKGDLEGARKAYRDATTKSAHTESGKSAAERLKVTEDALANVKAEEERQAKEAAEAAAKAKQAKIDACSCFVTICKAGPEKAEAFKTKSECDSFVKGFDGFVKCLPCECGTDVPDGASYCRLLLK